MSHGQRGSEDAEHQEGLRRRLVPVARQKNRTTACSIEEGTRKRLYGSTEAFREFIAEHGVLPVVDNAVSLEVGHQVTR